METKTAVPQWTIQDANLAASQNTYIKVGPKKTKVALAAAPNRWRTSPQDIYVPDLRIAGERDAIVSELKLNNYSDSEISTYLDKAFTSENYKTSGVAERFAQLSKPSVEMNDLKYADQNWGEHKIVSSKHPGGVDPQGKRKTKQASKTQSKSKSTTTSTSKGGRRIPLMERLQNLKADRVLDVSNMRDDGSDIKPVSKPGPKSSKIGVDGINLVSSSPENYAKAVRSLGPEYLGYIDMYNAKYAASQQSKSQIPGPQAPRSVVQPALYQIPQPQQPTYVQPTFQQGFPQAGYPQQYPQQYQQPVFHQAGAIRPPPPFKVGSPTRA